MNAVLQGATVALLVAGAGFFLVRRCWPGRPGCGRPGGDCHCGGED